MLGHKPAPEVKIDFSIPPLGVEDYCNLFRSGALRMDSFQTNARERSAL